jgi:hypothetical protein
MAYYRRNYRNNNQPATNGSSNGGFDRSKDRCLASLDLPVKTENGATFLMALMSYDGKPPKIAVMMRGTPDTFGQAKVYPVTRMLPDVAEAFVANWAKFKKQVQKQLLASKKSGAAAESDPF